MWVSKQARKQPLIGVSHMNNSPTFAVVGHPNKGKSSVVATLSQNDAIAIALEPGTTRASHAYPLRVDGKTLYTLVDTPGFQRPRRVLEWLEAHSASAQDRRETVRAFVTQHKGDGRFTDECELLSPLLEGAGIIYVVDGSVPYNAEHEAEMTILRWTGQASLALINSIGVDDYSDAWLSALGQFFQVVRKFNAVKAPFEQHLSLLRAFGQLEPAWEQSLNQAVQFLLDQREQRKSIAAQIIATAMIEMMTHTEKRTLGPHQTSENGGSALGQALQTSWYASQREREQLLRLEVEHLYQHQHIVRQETVLNWHAHQDLFSEQTRKNWAVGKGYLASAGFGAGAAGGVGIDALTLGSSFGAAALLGGIIGATTSYLYADKLVLPALNIDFLKDGLKTVTFGPIQDSQFAYVILGRAIDHWWQVSHRNHAGRDLLALKESEGHWIEKIDNKSRRALQKILSKCAKKDAIEISEKEAFDQAIIGCMAAYKEWQLKNR